MSITVSSPSAGLPEASPPHPAGPAAEGDEILMLRYRNGDDESFRRLYQRYRAPLMRFSQRLCQNATEAEEIFQETWMAVIHTRHRYSVRARFVTWLFSIAHRRAADRHRARSRKPTEASDLARHENLAVDLSPGPAERAMADARLQALQLAIAALPFEQREVFLLRSETGLGLRQISAMTGAPAETTKSRLRYALRSLRRCLEPWT